jgi:hypothetical protein
MPNSAPEPTEGTATVAELLEHSLIVAGKLEQAAAFRRQVAPSLADKPYNYTVRAGKDQLPKLLDEARRRFVCTISSRAKLEDAVLVISIDQLAYELGELAVGFEQAPTGARHPRSMFAAVDRLPSLSHDDVEIDLGRETPLPAIETLP